MITRGMPFDFGMFAGFICMLGSPSSPPRNTRRLYNGLTRTPHVNARFTDADCALMIALYIAMDSFGTACNVTGDGAIAIAVARIFGKNKQE